MIIGKGLYVKKYQIYSPKLPLSFDGFKFIFISDLHGKIYGKEKFEDFYPEIKTKVPFSEIKNRKPDKKYSTKGKNSKKRKHHKNQQKKKY